MYDAEETLINILIMTLEGMNPSEYKEFVTTQLDELNQEDFDEVIHSTDNKVIYKDVREIDTLTDDILEWHADRKITVNGNSLTQSVKLGEEFGELCAGIVKGNKTLVKDSIGDMYVVMCAIAELEGTTIEECISHAYEEIKDRKGYLNEHGNFIKDETNSN